MKNEQLEFIHCQANSSRRLKTDQINGKCFAEMITRRQRTENKNSKELNVKKKKKF